MENITLGQIGIGLAFLVGLIGSIKYLANEMNNKVEKVLQPINQKIDNLELSSIKTDLVNFMCLAEHNQITDEQKINAHELYDRYCSLGGNSYVHDKWEKLRKEDKI